MTKLKKTAVKLKAKRLTKAYLESGLNQSRLARRQGVTKQTINRKINKKPVQDCLAEFLESEELRKALILVARDGLGAVKTNAITVSITKKGKKVEEIKLIKIADHPSRHKFWHDLMINRGQLKIDGGGTKVQVFVGSEVVTKIKELEGGQVKSDDAGDSRR